MQSKMDGVVHYLSWIAGSTKNYIIFRHAEIFENIFLKEFVLVKANEAYFGVFGNILFAQMKSSTSPPPPTNLLFN